MTSRVYHRATYGTLLERLAEQRRFVQVLAGPRQVGKTTLVQQVLADIGLPAHYASADDAVGRDREWITQQWTIGRLRAQEDGSAVLVLDEVQKVTRWSDTVKLHWDEDTAGAVDLRVVLLGSAPLLLGRGLSESLAGRFETIPVPHWSFSEMREAFGFTFDQFVFFGGYPGAASLVGDEERWRAYIVDSLVETTLSRDILLLSRIDKPALLRQLFRLSCAYSGQILSYTKMLGKLQDAGNTTTLAHYLELLAGAGTVTGLQKYSGSEVRSRGSSPKLLVLNTALMSATQGLSFVDARADSNAWGRLVESAVGAHLVNARVETFYWRDRNREVDFVTRSGRSLTAFEITSGARKHAVSGLQEFTARYGGRALLVGGQGIPVPEFLESPAERWVT